MLEPRWQLSICRDSGQLAARYTECLTVRFLGPPTGFRMVLATDEPGYPKQPYLAIRYDDQADAKPEPSLLKAIKQRVDLEYAVGKASYSVWYRYVDKAYSSWGTADALLRLYRRGPAVTYFVEHLQHLARVLEKALDACTAL